MEEIILKAVKRIEKPKQVRDSGFIPGVLNESDTSSTSVMFEAAALNKIVARHGHNAKIWVELEGKKDFGFIMELQKHPVENRIIHVSIKLLKKDQEMKMMIPLSFHGRDELTHKMLELQIYKPEIEVSGLATDMPDNAIIDVSTRIAGDHITAADLNLPKGIKVLELEDEIFAVIKLKREVEAEPEAEEAPAAAAAAPAAAPKAAAPKATTDKK
ncbi:MAG: 50S ribosomal protein L25 [Saccharofermentanales bacterium]